jgi:hypothetical protein
MAATQTAIPLPHQPHGGTFAIAYSAAVEEAHAAAGWLRKFSCGLGGHDMLLQFEPGRLSLRCANCGQETPGWALTEG